MSKISKKFIQKNAKFIRIQHLKVTKGSLFLSDLDTPENKQGNNKIPVYIPYGGTVDILLTDRTLTSYQQGSIRGFIGQGYLEGWIVENFEVEESQNALQGPFEVEIDESLVTIDTSNGNVTVNLPDLLSEPEELRTPEGTRFTVKKISQDDQVVLITPFPGNLLENSTDPYILNSYLEVVTFQSDDQGQWWRINGGEGGTVALPDRSLLSHYNQTDGTSNPLVLDPVFDNFYVAVPDSGGLYGTGGWDDGALHPVTQDNEILFTHAERCTDLEEGTIDVDVSYYDASDALVSQTLRMFPRGTPTVESVPGIEVSITGLVSDLDSIAGFIEVRIIPGDLPDFSLGGRIDSVVITHTVDLVPHTYAFASGVFVDLGPKLPLPEGNPTISLENETFTFLSGVPHYTNGTILRVQQRFQGSFNKTYPLQPFRLDARDLAEGFGQSSYSFNSSQITLPRPNPFHTDAADLEATLTLTGSNTVSKGGSVFTSVLDPSGSVGTASQNLSNTLFLNRSSQSTRNYEGFLSESRRRRASSDNTVPDPRDGSDWDSQESLTTFDTGFGAQVSSCEGVQIGVLKYPDLSYGSFSPSGPNYQNLSGELYEGISDIRWYYRFFSNSSGFVEHAGGVLRLEAASGTLTEADLLSDKIIVEVMLCNPSSDPNLGGRSGWLSLNKPFNAPIFDPDGSTREIRGCYTGVSENNEATAPPDFGFTLSSNLFAYFTSIDSNYGIRVRIGLRQDQNLTLNAVSLVGW